ncbi:MAG: nucleotidyltransferase domain-containing protein [Candidatus Zixiibacteriota bacterium]
MTTGGDKNAPSLGIKSGIGEALFSKIRRKVLALFLLNPEKQFYFRETVRILDESPGALQREMKSLTSAGILIMRPIGVQTFYQANMDNPIFHELQSIVQKTFGVGDILRDVFRKHAKNEIAFACIYGSIAAGRDTGESDIDLLVVGSIPFRYLVSMLKPIEEHIRRPINPTLYTPEDFREKLHAQNNFLQNVMAGEMFFIVGFEHDLAKLAE